MSKACRDFLSFLPPQEIIKLINSSDMTHITTQLINSRKFTHFRKRFAPTSNCKNNPSFAELFKYKKCFQDSEAYIFAIPTQLMKMEKHFPRNRKILEFYLKRFQSNCQSWITTSSGHGFQFQISARLTNFEREMFYATSQAEANCKRSHDV